MLKLLTSWSRKQKAYIFLGFDLALIPLVLLFTYAVQALPQSALQTLYLSQSILPYLLVIACGLSMWLGIPYIQLNDYERHAIGLTAIFAGLLAVVSAGLSWMAGLALPPGTHVVFGLSYFLFLVASRATLHQVVLAIYHGSRPRRRVLIYGAGTTGTQLA